MDNAVEGRYGDLGEDRLRTLFNIYGFRSVDYLLRSANIE